MTRTESQPRHTTAHFRQRQELGEAPGHTYEKWEGDNL